MTTTPPTSPFPPAPSQTGRETWLNRVQGLLAKAESTEFPDEREALLTKAQELMARHAIDDAMLAAAGHQPGDTIESETLEVRAPYATAKAALLGTIAQANNCRCVMTSKGNGNQSCVIVGHASDLASVRSLYAALSLHAVRTMLDAALPPQETPRRFRHAFLLAFTSRIGERLRAAASSAQAQAEAQSGPGVGLVLADRSAAVTDAFREAFPRVRNARLSHSSFAGAAHGRSAAERVGLGQTGLGGNVRAIRG